VLITALINLHSHSRYSDGTLSPSELAVMVAKAKIEYFSLTDHDICLGWAELEPSLKKLGIRYTYGIELSTRLHDNLHILGYGFDLKAPLFLARLEEFRSRRLERVKKILALLREQGFDVSFEELKTEPGRSYGRPHIADLMKSKGMVKTRQKAFEKHIAYGKSAYCPPYGPDIEEAIRAVKDAGGIAVLAHPGVIYKILELGKWKEMGLDGIEAFYPVHTNVLTREFLEMAKKYGLLVTAGTDYHGPGSGRGELYGFDFHQELLEPLKERFL
jgi:hypothetical protein